MWPHGTLKKSSQKKKQKWKELNKPIECSDVLVQCQQLLAAVSVNVCEAAEAPEEQAGK